MNKIMHAFEMRSASFYGVIVQKTKITNTCYINLLTCTQLKIFLLMCTVMTDYPTVLKQQHISTLAVTVELF